MAQRQDPVARRLTPDDVEAATRFIHALPERDLTFFKENLDEDTVERWCRDDRGSRWIIGDRDEVHAMLSVVPGALWSAHVGELRMVVGPEHRRRGRGRALARVGLAEGVRLGLRKIVVEVAADREGDIAMFTAIGFRAEALLTDHIRDHAGELHDLVVLSHDVGSVSGSLTAIGLAGALDSPSAA